MRDFKLWFKQHYDLKWDFKPQFKVSHSSAHSKFPQIRKFKWNKVEEKENVSLAKTVIGALKISLLEIHELKQPCFKKTVKLFRNDHVLNFANMKWQQIGTNTKRL